MVSTFTSLGERELGVVLPPPSTFLLSKYLCVIVLRDLVEIENNSN